MLKHKVIFCCFYAKILALFKFHFRDFSARKPWSVVMNKLVLSYDILNIIRKKNVFFPVDGNDRFRVGDIIYLDENFRIESYVGFLGGNTLPNMGSFSYTHSELPIGMKIGRYCSISWGLNVISGNHPLDFVSTSSFSYDEHFSIFRMALGERSINRYPYTLQRANRDNMPKIGHDVWIGQNATLSRGIVLGTGCVVAANSVVTKSVPEYAIVGGNPAKLIRYRFSESIILKLLEIEWWKYNFVDFGTLRYDDPLLFIRQMHQLIDENRIKEFVPDIFSNDDIKELSDEIMG
jgi:acetyltransferase-like isoleucine patch superfamily enzyme